MNCEDIIKAAEQGHAEAQFNLGEIYSFGEGVQLDFDEAIKWHLKAAEQADAKAQLKLDEMKDK